MEIPIEFVIALVLFIAISLVVSVMALWLSIFQDDHREKRLLKLENDSIFLKERIVELQREGIQKDEKIASQGNKLAAQALQIIDLQEQLYDKERQILDLRLRMRPGTL